MTVMITIHDDYHNDCENVRDHIITIMMTVIIITNRCTLQAPLRM